MDRKQGRLAGILIALVLGTVVALAMPANASIAVNCASQNLQMKIMSASAGSTLLVKGTCNGNFTVNKVLTIEGNPSATLDGDDSGSVLTVTGSPTVHLLALTIPGGLAPQGAGIDVTSAGTVTLKKVKIQDNLAFDPSTAQGGGIYSAGGSLGVTASSIVENRALASGASTATAEGGGIWTAGPLSLSGSTVGSNRATARSSGGSTTAEGGGVDATGGTLKTTSS